MMTACCAETDVYHQAFSAFVEKYGKVYASEAEQETHFAAFKVSYLFVEAENHKGKSFKVALNDMSDWTDKEMGNRHLSLRGPASLRHSHLAKNSDLSNVADVGMRGTKFLAIHGIKLGSD